MSTVIAPTASLFSERSPSGSEDTDDDQLADQRGMPYRQMECDTAADAEPEDVRLRHLQVLQQADDVGRQVGAGERSVNVVGAPVSLEVGSDHLAIGSQAR
jgi:hypothetical protein